jgi:hypothetical protein
MKLKDMKFTQPTASLLRVIPDNDGEKWLKAWLDFLDEQFHASIRFARPELFIDPTAALGGERHTRFGPREDSPRLFIRGTGAAGTAPGFGSRTGKFEPPTHGTRVPQDGWAVFGNLYVPVIVEPIER